MSPRSPFPAWLAALALALLLPLSARAENSVRAGDITVHYNAVPTTMLTPEVARQSGVTRSSHRALLNIAVRRGEPGTDQAVAATVRASATNLSGQRQEIRLREVREGEALYYLGEARITPRDSLEFEIEVVPEGGSAITARFRQEFFEQ